MTNLAQGGVLSPTVAYHLPRYRGLKGVRKTLGGLERELYLRAAWRCGAGGFDGRRRDSQARPRAANDSAPSASPIAAAGRVRARPRRGVSDGRLSARKQCA